MDYLAYVLLVSQTASIIFYITKKKTFDQRLINETASRKLLKDANDKEQRTFIEIQALQADLSLQKEQLRTEHQTLAADKQKQKDVEAAFQLHTQQEEERINATKSHLQREQEALAFESVASNLHKSQQGLFRISHQEVAGDKNALSAQKAKLEQQAAELYQQQKTLSDAHAALESQQKELQENQIAYQEQSQKLAHLWKMFSVERQRVDARIRDINAQEQELADMSNRLFARGLIEGVCLDGIISPVEQSRVNQWFLENGLPDAWAQELFSEIQAKYEAQWIADQAPSNLPEPLTETPLPAETPKPTTEQQQDFTPQLKSMIQAAAADGVISFEELAVLQRWATDHGLSIKTLKDAVADARREHAGKLVIQNNAQTLSNKEKGDFFERYIVDKFDPKYFKLIEWRSDKMTTSGQFARSAMQPDLEFEFRLRGACTRFAIECKWRHGFVNDEIQWCSSEAQLERYQAFAKTKKISVFVMLGVGGMPQEPQSIFIIPLSKLEGTTVSRDFLIPHRKTDRYKRFYFDPESQTLR